MSHVRAASRWHRLDSELAVWFVVVAAWAVLFVAQLSGAAASLHHHALIESGPPLAVDVVLFAGAWLLMTAAMMLPASIQQIRASAAALPFVWSYFLVWSVFGVACLLGDSLIHRIVESTPLLLERPWLVEAGLVALAGIYQFTPLKRRWLRACRHLQGNGHGRGGFRSGLVHALDCLGASGPLMLLMFGAGFANLWWMAGLTVLMAYETTGRHGERASALAGFALLYLAVLALTNQGLPAWPPA